MSGGPTAKALHARWALRAMQTSASVCRRQPLVRTRPRAMGLRFAGVLGLAAGLDRCGRLAGTVAHGGFGAMEFGSVSRDGLAWRTLRRALGRAEGARARQGAVRRGVSLVKPKGLPWADAAVDGAKLMRALWRRADYITLNPGRHAPAAAVWAEVVAQWVAHRDAWVRCRGGRMPLVVKLPAHGGGVSALVASGADGLLVSAEGVDPAEHHRVLRAVSRELRPGQALFSVGGVLTRREVRARVRAGATLVQVHGAVRRSQRVPWLHRTCTGL